MGAADFVEKLAEHLADAPLRRNYRSQASLERDLARQVAAFTRATLLPLGIPFGVWQEKASPPEEQDPVMAFGRDFRPHIAIEVAEIPTAALVVKLIKKEGESPAALGAALGQALIVGRLYPAILAFVLDRGQAKAEKHWWDRELRMELWSRYKIKLVIRP